MTRYSIAILIALTMAANAQDFSANKFLPGCKAYLGTAQVTPKSIEAFLQGRCFGLVEGLQYTGAFCVPSGVTNNQAVTVVVKYIEARPERMHESFGMLALEALTAAWPCKR